LTGDEHLTLEFATTWRTFDLDAKTRALLEYAEELTKSPGTIDDAAIDSLRASGWGEQGIYEATALISLFNFTGRMEAASGLPLDEVPAGARPPETRVEAAPSRRPA
jgi:alkylhydroperoxidase family enzyme